MPNRTIREGFLDSEAIATLDWFTECVYHRLLIASDDAGRFDGRDKIVTSRCFPLHDKVRSQCVGEALSKLELAGLLLRYEFQGKVYVQLTKVQRYGSSTESKWPWTDGSYCISFIKIRTRDGEKEFVSTSVNTVEKSDTPFRPPTDPLPTPSEGGTDPIDTGFIYDNDIRITNTKDDIRKTNTTNDNGGCVLFGKNKNGEERSISRDFWNKLCKKYGMYEAALYYYRAKDAKNIEAYIQKGTKEGYIFKACPDEDNAATKVKSRVQELIDRETGVTTSDHK